MISTWILYLQMFTLGAVATQATFLETEDKKNLACGDPPILVEVTNITQTTATISWTPIGDETEWDLAVVPAGTLPPISATDPGITPNPTINYTGLTASSAYDVYVRAVCTGTPGAWSSAVPTFITQLTNPSNCQLDLPVPDNDCQRYFIEVTGAAGTSLGADVYLNEVIFTIFHEWADDLDITLISPSGAQVEITSDNGDGETHYGDPADLTCTSNARFINTLSASGCSAISIDGQAAPFVGDYLPEENLNGFNDGSNPNGIWTLEICDDAFDDAGVLEYVELVFANVTCGAPADLSLVTTDSTFVVLDWQTASSCATTLIEYGPAGFTPGVDGSAGMGGTVVMVGCPPQQINGLNPETDYDFYVREMCGVGLYSANACTLPASTLCSPAPATEVENFNADTLCAAICDEFCGLSGIWQNDVNAPLSWITFSGATPTQTTGPTDDFPGGGNYLFLEGTGTCLTNDAAILKSNCMEILAPMGGNCHFSFNYYMFGAAVGTLNFEVSTDGGLTWTTLWTESGNQGEHWFKAYIDLSAYLGQTVQCRLVGTKGLNSRSDIAIDNLVFYGPVNQGPAPFTYYQDIDGDTYGNDQVSLESCSPTPPPGYVDTPGDCMDNVFEVNPGVPETPCDNFDFNCNGNADEKILPTPVVTHDTICSGDLALVKATPEFGGIIIWYDSLVGGSPIDTGTSFVPLPALENNTAMPVTFTFYAEEMTMDTCVTGVRGAATVLVNPQPAPNVVPGQLQPLCGGEQIDLSSLIIEDLNNTGAVFTFHESLPATVANQINPPVVSPPNSRFYYIQASSAGGCTEIDSFLIETLPSPEPLITGDLEQCLGVTQTLSATNVGAGQAPFSYQWSNGGTNTSIDVSILGPLGAETTYYLTITDDAGCQGVDSFTITAVTSINSVGTSSSPVTDCDGTDGSITLNPSGGFGPYNYTWSGPINGSQTGIAGAYMINGLSQGAYSVTVTDNSVQACEFVVPTIIVNGPTAEVSVVDIQDVTCQGFVDGCIEINVVGNNPSILWSNGVTTAENCNLLPGSYNVTVTDGPCTTVVENLVVNQPPALEVDLVELEDALCFNEASGVVSILAFGGTGPYEYAWNIPGPTQPSLSNVPEGSYSVTVTDANGCIQTAGPFEVGEPSQLQTALIRTSPSCSGDDDGILEVLPSGGTPPYSYLWNTGSNLSNIENLLPGDYSVTVGDVNGCSIVIATDISDPPPLAAAVVNLQEASCFGLSDGFINLDVTGGTGALTFNWSNGGNTEDISNLASGAYQLTVTDNKGCVFVTDTFFLEAPELVEFDFAITNASCTGIPDGTISSTPISGTGPFTYLWDNGSQDPDLSGLEGGSYDLTVTDDGGCVSLFTVDVPADQPMEALISPISPNCAGGQNGEIFLNITGGQGPYDYAWSSGSIEADIEDLGAGGYVATVVDANNCVLITDTIFLSDPPEIVIELIGIDSISCFGEMDGNITVGVTGGLPPYSYTWSNDEVVPNLTNIGAGTYILTVEDELNCAVSGPEITLPQPGELQLSTTLVDENVSCEGNVIDSVALTINGGTAPFNVQWSNGQTGTILSGAGTGEYAVSVTDAFGCFASLDDIKIPDTTEVLQLNIDPDFFGGLNCDEYGDEGGVRILISGGFPPYQYNWSNGINDATADPVIEVTGLVEGTYSVTVTDNNGCIEIIEEVLVDPPAPIIANAPGAGIVDVSCNGGDDGSITLLVNGGFDPYFFVWTDESGEVVSNDQNPTNLPAGTYDVLVFDANGCNGQYQGAVINEPATSVSIEASTSGNFCFGDNDGIIDLTVSGGSGPYDFLWADNGNENEDRQNLPSGYYYVTVNDQNGCIAELDSILVTGPTEPLEIVSAEINDALCFEQNSGSIDLEISGGTMPYTYFWDNGTFNEDLTEVGAGTYSCMVLDNNSCPISTDIFTISEPPAIVWLDTLISPSTEVTGNGVAEINAFGGTPPLSYLWSSGDDTPRTDSLLGDETYTLTVTDGNGCMIMNSVYIEWDTVVINSVSDIRFDQGWEVHPNPTNDLLEISWNLESSTGDQWRLVDMYGRTVYVLDHSIQSGQVLQLSLDHLSAGVYWLQVYTSDDQVGTKKIILLQ